MKPVWFKPLGRSARNVNAEVILYGDKVTNSMARAIEETERRRKYQLEHNAKHGIIPKTVFKEIKGGIEDEIGAGKIVRDAAGLNDETEYMTAEFIKELESEMLLAAENLDFERAAELRDRIETLKGEEGQPVKAGDEKTPGFAKSGGRRNKKGKKKTIHKGADFAKKLHRK